MNVLANVKLEDNQGKIHFSIMFTNWILSIIKPKRGILFRKLLQTSTTIDHHDSCIKSGAKQ